MNNLSLYLHFPFCKAKCNYCDFYSVPHLARREAYEKALCDAVLQFGQKYPNRTLSTVYFGGGTPSLVSSDGLKRIIDAVRRAFVVSDTAEITMEMNPESTTDLLLSTAKEEGVNRLSFGLQSTKDNFLSVLGRLHNASDAVRALEKARKYGFRNVSLDLMYGLPNQTLSLWQETLRETLSLQPEHLSFYLLTLSPKTPLYKQRDLIPEDDVCREMYLWAHSYLEENGYEHYEISNAAKSGFRSRHNQVYWTGGEYLGIGAAAYSCFEGQRFGNSRDIDGFIRGEDITEERYTLTDTDRINEYVMLSLRLYDGLSLEKYKELSGDDLFLKYPCIDDFVKGKYMELDGDRLRFTDEGFFISNAILSELFESE